MRAFYACVYVRSGGPNLYKRAAETQTKYNYTKDF